MGSTIYICGKSNVALDYRLLINYHLFNQGTYEFCKIVIPINVVRLRYL
jgi:hypothetical protein